MAEDPAAPPTPDLDALREDLARLSRETGFAYDTVFERMVAGQGLGAALDLPEGTAAAIYALAYARFNAGDLDRALPLFHALVLLEPKSRDNWLGLGLCLRGKGRLADAMPPLSTASALAPEDPVIVFHCTELACQTDDWTTAKAEMDRFINLPQTAAWRRLAPEMRKLATAIDMRS